MKKIKPIHIMLFILLMLIVIHSALGQLTGDGFHYKTKLTDNYGSPVANQSVDILFTIIDDNANTLYKEGHSANTDNNGIVDVIIGEGTPLQGDFSVIEWSSPRYLNVQIDFGNGWVDFGTQAFKYVPFAKRADVASLAEEVDFSDITNVPADLADGDDTGATKIDDLLDGKSDAGWSSVFLGFEAGNSDDGTDNLNVAVGKQAMKYNTSGQMNVAVGGASLLNNTTGLNNTALGAMSLRNNTSGNYNVGVGTVALYNNTTGTKNSAVGFKALFENTTGERNVAMGSNALKNNTEGNSNIAVGNAALANNTVKSNLIAIGDSALYNNGLNAIFDSLAVNNIAIGNKALSSNTTGFNNYAWGHYALQNNEDGYENIAIGTNALNESVSGRYNIAMGTNALRKQVFVERNIAIGVNTLSNLDWGAGDLIAIGPYALENNTSGESNVAIGVATLNSNTTGTYCIGIGSNALARNTTGDANIGIGFQSLMYTTTGSNNTAIGNNPMVFNTTGEKNVALGSYVLYNSTKGNKNTGIGYMSLLNIDTTSYNTALGHYTYVSLQFTNSTALGDGTQITSDNQVRIGHNVTSIGGPVGWTNLSDARFKRDVKDNVPGLDFILKLRPVTYYLDTEKFDRANGLPEDYIKEKQQATGNALGKIRFSGFIAQEVEQAAESIGYDFSGVDKPKNDKDFYGLRYAEFVVPLVKAVQELKKENDSLKEKIDYLEKRLERLEKRLQNNR